MPNEIVTSLILNAINCQELNELMRSKRISSTSSLFNNTSASENDHCDVYSALSTSLIQVVRLLFNIQTHKQEANLNLPEVESSLNCIYETLGSLQKEIPNFYGEFRKEIPLKHLLWLSKYLTSQLIITEDKVSTYPIDDIEINNSNHGHTNYHKISNLLSRIFWYKHFGINCCEVEWLKFMNCFNEDYGIQPERVVDILKNAFTSRQDTNDHHQNSETVYVNVHRYEELTMGVDGGLYSIYQQLCDPVTVVFEMGTIEDTLNPSSSYSLLNKPTLIQGLLGLSIKQVCCGGQHAAVLTHNGTIHTWGRGGFGRLGHGKVDTIEYPREVVALKHMKCKQVVCGFAYTAAVTEEGVLYTWGAGENGRLGLGDAEDRHVPSRVEELNHLPVHQVYAGSVHTCVLTCEGQVYSFGKHEYTGHGSDGSDVLLPRLLDAFGDKTVSQISVGPGGYHTIALTTDYSIFTWGHNRVGQLGYGNGDLTRRNGEGAHFIPVPKLVPQMQSYKIKQIVAGWGHSAVLTQNGQVLVCGRNLQGQLGLGNPNQFPKNERDHPYQDEFVPITTLSHCKVKQIACGGEHSVALGYDNSVYTFGAGNKGQLGHSNVSATNGGTGNGEMSSESEYYPKLVQLVKNSRREIHQVACGNNCTLILAGRFNPPSLVERCIEVICATPELVKQIGESLTSLSHFIY